MIFASTHPTVICLEADPAQLEALRALLTQTLTEFDLFCAATAEEGLKELDRLVLERSEVGLILAAHGVSGGQGEAFLLQAYEKWPHAIRLLVADPGDVLDEALLDAAKVFRILKRPLDEVEFKASMRETARFYRQRQELTVKSHVLTELHRASMTLIGERNLQKLLHKLMRIVIENANALNGYIILARDYDQTLFIEAEGHIHNYETRVLKMEVNDFSPVCPAIVEYARKTSENVILHDALHEGLFTNHPFVRRHQVRSILCTPLIYQGQFLGMLYLDNKEETHAFSAFNVELLRLLSAPAAIAIQNARLYTDLEAKVGERTAEVIHQKGEIERQRDQIQQKNTDILDSIRYAKRIQDAILPSINEMKEVFRNSFVYFKPKDIVSGDFYWFSKRLSKVIIAAADCTGHGIPGAFMTVMANTLLKQIVELEGIFKPNEILYHLHIRMRVALHQDTDTEGSQDGLEIALCQIDIRRRKLQFAGANRPLVLIRGREIVEMKGDKFGIGGLQEENTRRFTNHTLELQEGDVIYIFSDGYPDQIGDEINKKFLSRRFFNMLLDVHDKSMDHQKMLLDGEYTHWRGDREQTDDITIIGIQF